MESPATSFILEDDQGYAIDGNIVSSRDNLVATFTPSSPLAFSTEYNATLTTAVTDFAGNNLSEPIQAGRSRQNREPTLIRLKLPSIQ